MLRGRRNDINWQGIEQKASNLVSGENPSYSSTDFLELYPQFDFVIPQSVLDAYIEMANHSLQYARWYGQWSIGMALFIAHYCTLWLQTSAGLEQASPSDIGGSGMLAQNIASTTVGAVSATYTNTTSSSLDDWGAYTQTEFGVQFASMAKIIGAGAMYVR